MYRQDGLGIKHPNYIILS